MKIKNILTGIAMIALSITLCACSTAAPLNSKSNNKKDKLSSGSWTGTIDGKEVTINGAYLVDGKEVTIDGDTYESAKANEAVFLVVNGGKLTIKDATIKKTGSSENKEESSNQGNQHQDQQTAPPSPPQEPNQETSENSDNQSGNNQPTPNNQENGEVKDGSQNTSTQPPEPPQQKDGSSTTLQSQSKQDSNAKEPPQKPEESSRNTSQNNEQGGNTPQPGQGQTPPDKPQGDNQTSPGGNNQAPPQDQNKNSQMQQPGQQGGFQNSPISSSEENNNFYGLNSAVVCVGEGSEVIMENCNISTDAEGANAVFAANNAKISIDTIKIDTSQNSSRGLYATYGGTIEAENVDISTKGAHCAPLATDRGGGTVTVTGEDNKLSTEGEGSPLIYSTGNISVSNASGNSSISQIFVIEGKNKVLIDNCDFSSDSQTDGAMIYQSMSGDAADEDAASDIATTSIKNSKLTYNGAGKLFYITNTQTNVNIENCEFKNTADTLISAAAGRWGTENKNGGTATFSFKNTELSGTVSADSISSLEITSDKETKNLKTTGNANIKQQQY